MIYVIRHGQVDTNIKKEINGWNEEILNSNYLYFNSQVQDISKFKQDNCEVVSYKCGDNCEQK